MEKGKDLLEILMERGGLTMRIVIHHPVRRPALEDPEHRLWCIKHILLPLRE